MSKPVPICAGQHFGTACLEINNFALRRRCERVEAENAKLEVEVTRLAGLDATQAATIRALEAENERLVIEKKEGIERAVNLLLNSRGCRLHSGDNTPPFQEFADRIEGRCLLCEITTVERLTTELANSEQRRCAAGDSAVTWQREAARLTNEVGRLRKALNAYSEDEILHPRRPDQPAPTEPLEGPAFFEFVRKTAKEVESWPECQPAPECAWIDCPHTTPHTHGGTVTYHPVPAPDACGNWKRGDDFEPGSCPDQDYPIFGIDRVQPRHGNAVEVYTTADDRDRILTALNAPEARDVGDLSMLENHDPHEALWFPAERVAELVSALEFYADCDELTELLVTYDNGARARAALAQWKERA